MDIRLDPKAIDSYRDFMRVKSLPSYNIKGRMASFPDEYSHIFGQDVVHDDVAYAPQSFLFDYQSAITDMALNKGMFAIFADCGLGKTLIYFEWIRAVREQLKDQGILLVSPSMVVSQTIEECQKFYECGLEIEQVKAAELQTWLNTCGGKVGITNYEAIKPELNKAKLGALILDESSMLKSHYGKWGVKLIDLGRGLRWKLAGTGTPAPNDRIEFANHAVFLDAFPTVNSFLAKYFVNRGQTGERWELKQHAIGPFYRALSHWSIFLTNPSVYGWEDNTKPLPPINVSIEDVDLTAEQIELAYTGQGTLFANELGGIATRANYGQIAKGHFKGKAVDSKKPAYIRERVASWQDSESTIIWCIYNEEQSILEQQFNGDAVSIKGSTPMDDRLKMIADFKAGNVKTLITKPKILGFGLNLQVCTRQVFSGLQDSYESYYQAVKRSNRIGSTKPLNVHIPITDIEEPMVANVLQKATRVESDAREQERIFREHMQSHVAPR